jgi:hypothetical protein
MPTPIDASASAQDSGTMPPAPDASSADGSAPPPPATDLCVSIPALSNAPNINGELEPGLVLHPVTPVGWHDQPDMASPPFPDGYSASIAAAWRPDGLYVFASVLDPNRVPADPGLRAYLGDGVEFYVDSDGLYGAAPLYDDPGGRQIIIAAPDNDDDTVQRGDLYKPEFTFISEWTSPEFGAFPQSGGYTVEAIIRAADLGLGSWTLSAGQQVGFNFSHNVSGEPGVPQTNGWRLGQYFVEIVDNPLQALSDYPYYNVEAFCEPTLEP